MRIWTLQGLGKLDRLIRSAVADGHTWGLKRVTVDHVDGAAEHFCDLGFDAGVITDRPRHGGTGIDENVDIVVEPLAVTRLAKTYFWSPCGLANLQRVKVSIAIGMAKRGSVSMGCQIARSIVAPMVMSLSLVATVPAAATTQCLVKRTSDGFVALRHGPSRTAGVAERLNAGDVVLISSDHEQIGPWIYVTKILHGGAYGASGWVLDRLVSKEHCS